MGTASMLRTDHHNRFPSPEENIAHITDGAFRDGFYLGRLAAERGAEPHAAIGRWATLKGSLVFHYRLSMGVHRVSCHPRGADMRELQAE